MKLLILLVGACFVYSSMAKAGKSSPQSGQIRDKLLEDVQDLLKGKPRLRKMAARLARKLTKPSKKAKKLIEDFKIKGRRPRPTPMSPVSCGENDEIRTVDGECNNVQNMEWGKAVTPFNRLLKPVYDDGVSAPRSKSVDGSPLPTPREVSVKVHETIQVQSKKVTLLLMQWGQFLDHDITHTPHAPLPTDAAGEPTVDCSECGAGEPCLPIPIPDNDPTFPPQSCMHFIRSLFLDENQAEQINQISAYIDASNVYGSDAETANQLRSFVDGKLKTSEGDRLPEDTSATCGQAGDFCFKAGDVRSNEQPGLTSMHNLWVNFHNDYVEQEKIRRTFQGKPTDDETLYQAGRKAVSGIHQHITYTEFLPLILGPKIMKKYKLNPSNKKVYDKRCDATILNEFATAAFRFGHSLVASLLPMKWGKKASVPLMANFFNSSFHHNDVNFTSKVLEGMTQRKSAGKCDRFIVPELRDELFSTAPGEMMGLDLMSLNIQRGRDHGLPSYTAYRKLFGLPVPSDFSDLDMNSKTKEAMETAYKSVEDIDLFTGILSERPLSGAILGPVGANILAEQFKRLKFCDRFYYENPLLYDDKRRNLFLITSLRFPYGGVEKIKSYTMSRVLCEFTKSPHPIALPRKAFSSAPDRSPLKCKAKSKGPVGGCKGPNCDPPIGCVGPQCGPPSGCPFRGRKCRHPKGEKGRGGSGKGGHPKRGSGSHEHRRPDLSMRPRDVPRPRPGLTQVKDLLKIIKGIAFPNYKK